MTVHLPDNFNPNQTAGTMCGLIFGDEGWDFESDCVITNSEEFSDVDCFYCQAMGGAHEHMRSIPHPQPVTLRVHELAKEAGRPKSKPVIEMLLAIGHDEVKTPASKVKLLGFEHEALVEALR